MKMNYTEAAKERCFSLIDTEIDNIWDDIDSMPEDTDSEKWKKKLTAIAAEYSLSSRFALMRIFQGQVVDAREIERDNSTGFEIKFSDGSVGVFKDISIEHAAVMKQDELDLYEKLMMDRAARQSGADYKSDLKLVQKALQNHQKKTTLLTKEEAMSLGHIIGLTMKEMEWFLLRVFNVDGGFRFNSSEDLIDAYVFLRAENLKTGISAAELKAIYNSKYGSHSKLPHDEYLDWTQDNGCSLPENVRNWSSDDCDERFMEWMGVRAEHLDLPSATALRVYRNLAVFAYNLANQTEDAPDVDILHDIGIGSETDFVRCIREIVSSKEYADQTLDALFYGDQLSEKKCKEVASSILSENIDLSFSEQTDKVKAYHVIDVLPNGKMSLGDRYKSIGARIQDLLLGKDIDVEKNDILYLLWFVANLCWFQGRSNPNTDGLTTRLFDFIDAAENCLDKAGLPRFYPAHLVEQSMMLSIIYAYAGPEKCVPAEVYEQVCSSIIERRAKHTNRKKSDNKQQSLGGNVYEPNTIA